MKAQFARSAAHHGQKQQFRQAVVRVAFAVAAVAFSLSQVLGAVSPAAAGGPELMTLVDLVQNGQGDAALQQVADYAVQLGGWTAAPGDELVFDPYMSRKTRGSSLDYDELPDCADPMVSTDEAACVDGFRALEQQVRFGPSLFTTPGSDGTAVARPSFDDLLSTYVEEVGHSWQEYLYETKGSGQGARVQMTSKAESERWAAGREYQVKRYILSLDGSLVHLSDEQRAMLRGQICDGYANPLGRDFPAYGAPQGWPNPEGWPVVAPTQAEMEAFCAG